MQASTTYHMQAAVRFFERHHCENDTDHTFTTKAVPANMQLKRDDDNHVGNDAAVWAGVAEPLGRNSNRSGL